MDKFEMILGFIYEILKTLLIIFAVFLAVSIFWQWLEFVNYGEIRPSKEDDFMAMVIALLSTELYRCKKGNRND